MANNEKRVYQQIEDAADFYEPAVYELLSFYHALENHEDPMHGQFVPLTSVAYRRPQDTKIFAIGLIPPSSNVTGRLLDRSASVRALQEGDDADLSSEEFPSVREDPFLVRPNAGLVESGSLSSPFGDRQLRGEEVKPHRGIDIAAPLGAEIRAASEGVVVDISPDGTRSGYGNTIIIEHSDGKLTLYAHMQRFGSGISVGTRVVAGTVVGFVGQTSSPNPMPRPHLHFEVLTKRVEHNGRIVANKESPPRLDPKNWLAANGRSIASSREADEAGFQAPFQGDGRSTNTWNTLGSHNANESTRTRAKAADKDLNQTNLGKKFLAKQEALIKEMQAAIERMAATPPLRMLINPQSFRVSMEKVISDGNWGRNGHIIEHWGDGQDRIEGSGKIAAFYSIDATNGNGPGLTRTARQFSQSYQNFLSLWLLYKNNGGVYLPDPITAGSHFKNLSVLGSVYVYYDEVLYVGSFDDFNLTEAETTPFTLEYSFNFTVRSWYLLDHLDDPQYTYGQPTQVALPVTTGSSRNDNTGSFAAVEPPPGQSFEGLINNLADGNG